MKVIVNISISIALMLLYACRSAPDLRLDSPEFSGFLGVTLELNQPLQIAPGKAGVYLQYGKIVLFNHLNEYQPYCKFEVRTIKQRPQTVNAGRFTVVQLRRDEEYVQRSPRYVASLINGVFGDAPIAMAYSTELYLHSETQPDVLRLTCAHWEGPADAVHLSVNQIRDALAPIFTLQIVQAEPSRSGGARGSAIGSGK